MSERADQMNALIDALASNGTHSPALAIEDLCRASAKKAVDEVLTAVFHSAVTDRMTGVLKLIHTEFSENFLHQIVEQAIERCTE